MRKYNVYYEKDRDSYNMVVEAKDEEEARYEALEELGYEVVHIEVVGEILS
jgi:predicted ATPase